MKKQKVGRPKGTRGHRLHVLLSKESVNTLELAKKVLHVTATEAVEEALSMLLLRLKNYKK